MSKCWPVLLLLTAAAACGDDDPLHLDVPPECNPLQGGACLAPWPTSTYLVADGASPTGVSLEIPVGAIPPGNSGQPFDPTRLNGRSGFSPATQIVAHFDVGLDGANLAGPGEIDASLTDASPTVILDAESGQRVAHFAEVDVNVGMDPSRQALYVRPAARLGGGRRYLVAIKQTLRAAGGGDIAVPAGFGALVSGTVTDNPRLEAMRPRYDNDIFVRLEAAGMPRDSLLLAWDFVTAPDEELRADLAQTASAAATFVTQNPSAIALHDVTVELDPRPGIARRVRFTFDSPSVRDASGLLRDASGRPEVRGTTPARGIAIVPACATAAAPAPITVFGHGFFGTLDETGGAYLQNFAARTCRIIIGTEWRGMCRDDLTDVVFALGDLTKGLPFGERIVQGMIDVETLVTLARGAVASQVLVDADGMSVADPAADLTFYGISQGHILGSTLFALDPVMTRGVLHVGGATWGLLFERSSNWDLLSVPFKGAYPDPLLQTLLQQVLQMGLDVIDPIHWAPLAGGPGTARKQYLLYASKHDPQVTNLATFMQARTMGIPLLAPSVESPYGLTIPTGVPMSALVIVDENPSPRPPDTNAQHAISNQAHEYPRRRTNLIDQMDAFLTDGTITNTCGGPCTCNTGACGDLLTD